MNEDQSVSGWRPSRPLPFYLPFGFVRCECGKRMREKNYAAHWDAEHEADAFLVPDHPSSLDRKSGEPS